MDGTLFGAYPADGESVRLFAMDGGNSFNHRYDDTQDRVDVTVGLINAVSAAVDATDVFKQTGGFRLFAEQGPVKDVADALKARLTAKLAQRCLDAPYTTSSSSAIEDRRRVLEALKKATEDESLKMLPQLVSAKNPDSWKNRFKEAGVGWTKPKNYKVPKGGDWKGSYQPLANALAVAALKKVSMRHSG